MERGRIIGIRLLEELEEFFQGGRHFPDQLAAGTGCFRALMKFIRAGVSFFFSRQMTAGGSVQPPSAKGAAASV